MKRIIETNDGGFDAMMESGKNVLLICGGFFYAGKLVGVNDDHVELDNAVKVFETGPLDSGPWEDAQALPGRWRVMKASIESWGEAKC